MKLLAQLAVDGVANAALYGVLAVAFGLVYRSLRIFHIAFAGLLVVSSYLFYTLMTVMNLSVGTAAAMTVFGAAVMGWLTERYFYRFFFTRGSSSGAVLVASLGLYIILENLLALMFGNEIRTIERPTATSIALGPVEVTSIQLTQALVGALTLVLLAILIRTLPVFKAIWALGEQPHLLSVLGLPLLRFREIVLTLSTMLAAMVGCLLCYDVGVDPHKGMSYLLIAAVAVLAGGLERYGGWVVGAFVLAMLQSAVVWKLSTRWVDAVTYGVLVVALMVRREGLAGMARRVEER